MSDTTVFSMEFGAMAGEEDEDVIVSLPAAEGEVRVTKVGEGAPVKVANEAVEDLKSQFASMTQRVTAAERTAQAATQHAQEATQRAQRLEGDVIGSQLDTVLSGIAAANAEAESAEREFATAFEAGDGAAQARAQRKIAGAEARLQRLGEAKDDLEDVAKRRPAQQEQPRQQAPQRRGHASPVEQFASSLSPRSAEWIRAHPECVTDQKTHARMMAAHNLAMADDIAVDSDAYFRRIEEGIEPVTKQTTSDGRRPSSAAAPAAGAGGSLNGGVEVRLTRGEAASATDGTLVWNYPDPTGKNRWQKGDPIGLAEMARRKHEGKKIGLYDKGAAEA